MKTKVKKADAKRPKTDSPRGPGRPPKQIAAAKVADGEKKPGLPWSKWPIEIIPLRDIKDDGENHRIALSAAGERARQVKLEKLAGSIKTCGGVMQPIAVQRGLAGGYDVIFGIRRRAAAKLAGLDSIQARIAPGRLSRAEVHEYRAIENNDREELNSAEQALAVKRVVDANAPMLGVDKAIDHAMVTFDLPRKTVTDMLWIVNELSPDAREVLATGGMHLQHARKLAKVGDKSRQTEIAKMIEQSAKNGRTWSIQEVENLAANGRHSLKQVPWDPAAKMKTGVEGCETCIGCPYNTATKPTLPGLPSLYEDALGTDEKDGLGYCSRDLGFQRKTVMATEKRKELPKAAAAIAKDEKLDKSEAGSAKVIAQAAHEIKADWLKLEPAARQVRQELGLQTPAKPGGAGGAGGAENGPKTDPREAAARKWEAAFKKWRDVRGEAIQKMIESHWHKRLAALLLLACDAGWPTYDSPLDGSGKVSKEPALKPSHDRILTHAQDVAANTNTTAIEELTKLVKWPLDINPDECVLVYGSAGPELLARLAKVFGAVITEPPKLEDFLPGAPSKPAAAKAAPADLKEPAGPPAAKK